LAVCVLADNTDSTEISNQENENHNTIDANDDVLALERKGGIRKIARKIKKFVKKLFHRKHHHHHHHHKKHHHHHPAAAAPKPAAAVAAPSKPSKHHHHHRHHHHSGSSASSSSSSSAAPRPCAKKPDTKQKLSIEQRWPLLVTDYHPVAINPNSVPDKVADRTARKIIREHAKWERENPAPPKQLSTRELKDMGEEIAKQTTQIKKEGTAFSKLAKAVDDEHANNIRAEKEKVLKAAAKAKADALAAQLKLKQDAEVKKAKLLSAKIAKLKKANAKKAKEAKAKRAKGLKA